MLGKVLGKNAVDAGLKNNRVIESNQTNVSLSEPTWLASPGLGPIHNIVSNEEKCLKELDSPSQKSSLLQLSLSCIWFEHRVRDWDRQPSVHLASDNVVLDGGLHVFRDVGVQVGYAGVPADIIDEPRQEGEETVAVGEKRSRRKVGRATTKLDLATRELPP